MFMMGQSSSTGSEGLLAGEKWVQIIFAFETASLSTSQSTDSKLLELEQLWGQGQESFILCVPQVSNGYLTSHHEDKPVIEWHMFLISTHFHKPMFIYF